MIVIFLLLANSLLKLAIWLLPLGENMMTRLTAYTNPIVIATAVYTLLIFSKLPPFYSPLINKIGRSAFSIYLIHMHSLTIPLFITTIQALHSTYSTTIFLAFTTLFLISIYVVATLVDWVRIFVYDKIIGQRAAACTGRLYRKAIALITA